MKTYVLKTKCGEVINKTKADNKDQASLFFAQVKGLALITIANLFIVEEILK